MLLRAFCWLLFAALLPLGGSAWIVSEAMVGSWVLDRTGPDPYARFEAEGAAIAGLWVVRVAAPALAVGGCFLLVNFDRLDDFVRGVARGLWSATRIERATRSTGAMRQNLWATWTCRGLLAAWIVLAMFHGAAAARKRLLDWPVFRLRSGEQVLPGMSPSNREVIRYLQQATPEDARILAFSDQKLFFVSYYVLPRRVFHPTHPASEFTIPQPNLQRQLEAYRRSDVDPAYEEAIAPDFVLEYFEGAAYVESERLLEDDDWVAFLRMLRGDPDLIPEYVVVLRPYQKSGAP